MKSFRKIWIFKNQRAWQENECRQILLKLSTFHGIFFFLWFKIIFLLRLSKVHWWKYCLCYQLSLINFMSKNRNFLILFFYSWFSTRSWCLNFLVNLSSKTFLSCRGEFIYIMRILWRIGDLKIERNVFFICVRFLRKDRAYKIAL